MDVVQEQPPRSKAATNRRADQEILALLVVLQHVGHENLPGHALGPLVGLNRLDDHACAWRGRVEHATAA